MQTQYYCSAQAAFWFGPQGRFQKRVKGARTALSACVAGFWEKTARGHGCPYLVSVLSASCRQNETLRDRKTCRRDAGSTLERHHEAPLNRSGCPSSFLNPGWLALLFLLSNSPRPQVVVKTRTR